MSTSFYHDLGDKLKACRRAKKLTLQQIADVLGKSTSTVSKYENGEISIDLELLIQWCRFLNLDINTVLPSTAPSSAQQELSIRRISFIPVRLHTAIFLPILCFTIQHRLLIYLLSVCQL